MATGGNISNGSKIGWSTASPMSWTKLGEVLNIGEVKVTADKIDRTIHGTSPYKREMPGMLGVAPMTITLSADANPSTSAAQAGVYSLFTNRTTVWWRVEVPTTRAQTAGTFAAYEFQGFVSDVTHTLGAPGDPQDFTFEITFDSDSFVKYAPMASALG